MSATTSTIPRRQHTQLQPLNTHETTTGQLRRRSYTPSASTLPSPSITAARAFFLETSPLFGQNRNVLQRRKDLIEGQDFPRRHSALPTPGGLATKFAKFTFPDQTLEVVQKIARPDIRVKIEEDIKVKIEEDIRVKIEEDEVKLKIEEDEESPKFNVKQNDILKVTAVATAAQTATYPSTASEFLQKVPFHYTHNRLRNWGHAYLGNSATADAFVNAVSLRRPSLQAVSEDGAEDRDQIVTIRARVLPKAKERKPFVIQRKFDIEELRASISSTQRPVSTPLRRSNRARRSSAQNQTTGIRRRASESPKGSALLIDSGAVPIHIEYALHFLPVLAALMLSGHVRKGDSIDLPIPNPHAWRHTISFIYTGKGEISASVRENILFLAGNAG